MGSGFAVARLTGTERPPGTKGEAGAGPKTAVVKDSVILLLGTILAQLITLAFLPLIGRIYDPAAFGTFHILLSVVALLLPVATLRYEGALLRVKTSAVLWDVLILIGGALVVVSLLAGLVAGLLVVGFGVGGVRGTWWIWALPAALFAAGLFHASSHLAIRMGNARLIAHSKVTQAGSTHGLSALTGLILNASAGALAMSDVVGRLFAGAMIIGSWMRLKPKGVSRRSAAQIKRTAARYARYPLFQVPGGLIGAAGAAVPVFVLAASASEAAAGQYAMAVRFVVFPFAMIALAVGQAVSVQLSAMARTNPHAIRPFLIRVAALSLAVGLALAGPLALFGEQAMIAILGSQWSLAGQMVVPLVPLMLAALVSGPINMALTIAGRARTQFLWDLGRLGLLLAALGAAVASSAPAQQIVLSYAVAMLASSLAFLVLALKRRRTGP